MKYFLIIYKDKRREPIDDALLKQHIAYIKSLNDKNHLIVCGPFVERSGAFLVIQTNDKSKAEAIMQGDPFIQQSYYTSYSLDEFYKADKSNDFLLKADGVIKKLKNKPIN